jgi:hypothetical protein
VKYPEAAVRKTNVITLLEILEREGEKDAEQLEQMTGIRKAIIVSTLFLAKKRGQIDSRPKSMAALEGRYEFSVRDEESYKRLSRCGWEVPEIADKLGMTETYVETMLMVASAPKEIRDMVERGMIDVMNAVEALKNFGDRAIDNVKAAMGASPQGDGRRQATKGQIYRFLTYQCSKPAEVEQPPEEPRIDFAAQLADFFTSKVRSAIEFYDARAQRRTVNLEDFRGGEGSLDGGRYWRDSVAAAAQVNHPTAKPGGLRSESLESRG